MSIIFGVSTVKGLIFYLQNMKNKSLSEEICSQRQIKDIIEKSKDYVVTRWHGAAPECLALFPQKKQAMLWAASALVMFEPNESARTSAYGPPVSLFTFTEGLLKKFNNGSGARGRAAWRRVNPYEWLRRQKGKSND